MNLVQGFLIKILDVETAYGTAAAKKTQLEKVELNSEKITPEKNISNVTDFTDIEKLISKTS